MTSKKLHKQSDDFKIYTASTTLSTSIDKKSMQQVYHYLDNPPTGTASLRKILKEIDREQQS